MPIRYGVEEIIDAVTRTCKHFAEDGEYGADFGITVKAHKNDQVGEVAIGGVDDFEIDLIRMLDVVHVVCSIFHDAGIKGVSAELHQCNVAARLQIQGIGEGAPHGVAGSNTNPPPVDTAIIGATRT